MLVGSWSWLWGARGIGDIDLAETRLVTITLSTACIPLVYLLARRVLSRPPALMAAVLFAVAPATVLFGRLVESEALLAPVAVAAVLLAAIALEQPCVRRPVIAGVVVLCMAAPLIKVPGIFVPAAVAAILLLGGRQKLGLAAAGAGVAGLLAYFGYGALLDQHTLLAIFHAQKSRHSGIWGGWELLVSAAGPNPLQRVRDGWWLLGVIALGGFAVRGGRTGLVLAVPALAYVLVIQLTADQSLVPQYGWYRIAVLPLVYLAAGWLLWRAAETPTLPLAALLVVLGASSSLSLAFGSGGAEWTPPLRDLAVMTAVPVLAALAHAARARISWALSASRILMGLYLAVLLAGNVMTSWNLESVYHAM
jgi:4-amino-4-deoxy-L-arabinose transferase-like glycosyltransferase